MSRSADPTGTTPRSERTERQRLLLVEDDAGVRRSLQLLLQARGFIVRSFAEPMRLLEDAAALEASCLVADYRMPGIDGLELLEKLRERGWRGLAILITGFPSRATEQAAHAAGYDAVLSKPARDMQLSQSIEALVRERLHRNAARTQLPAA